LLGCMFIRFDRIHKRDRHTDGQTDRQTPDDDIGRACIASRGKNCEGRMNGNRQEEEDDCGYCVIFMTARQTTSVGAVV